MVLKPGKYVAKVTEYGLPKTDKTPHVTVTFQFQEGGNTRHLTWFGYLSEKAQEKTIEQLFRCGFHGDTITRMLEPGALDFNKEVEIVIENEEFDGEVRSKIKWINEIGGMKFEQMAKEQANAQFGQLNTLIRAKRAELGVKPPKSDADDSDFAPGEEFKL